MGLLGSRATKEGRAVNHDVDAAHGGGQRARIEQVAGHQLYASVTQVARTRRVAHQRTDLVAAPGEPLRQSISHFSCGSVARSCSGEGGANSNSVAHASYKQTKWRRGSLPSWTCVRPQLPHKRSCSSSRFSTCLKGSR
jgi:hypothetical protein